MRNVEEIKRQVENSLLKKPNENYLIEKCLFCKDKLYKYYSFEGYAFQNLKDGILYCSSPKIFNDPFDCGLNFDLNQMWRVECIKTSFNSRRLIAAVKAFLTPLYE